MSTPLVCNRLFYVYNEFTGNVDDINIIYVLVKPRTPSLSGISRHATVVSNTDHTLKCDANGPVSGDIEYIFLKDSNQTLYTGIKNFYNLDSVTPADSGLYSCVVTVNGFDSDPSSERCCTLTVVRK